MLSFKYIRKTLIVRAISFALVLAVFVLQVPVDVALAFSIPLTSKSDEMHPNNIGVVTMLGGEGETTKLEWQNTGSLWGKDVAKKATALDFNTQNSAYLKVSKEIIKQEVGSKEWGEGVDLTETSLEEVVSGVNLREVAEEESQVGDVEILLENEEVTNDAVEEPVAEEVIIEPTEEIVPKEVAPEAMVPENSSSIIEETVSFLKKIIPVAHAQEETSGFLIEKESPIFLNSEYLEFSGFSFDKNSKSSTSTISGAELKISMSGAMVEGAFLVVEYSKDGSSWGTLKEIQMGTTDFLANTVSLKLPAELVGSLGDVKFRLSYKYPENLDSQEILLFVDSLWLQTFHSFINLNIPLNNFDNELILASEEKEVSSLEMTTRTAKMVVPGTLEQPFLFGDPASLSEQLVISPIAENAESRVVRESGFLTYENAYTNTNLRYETTENGLKEYIDLVEKNHPAEFKYNANLSDFDVVQVSDTEINLYKKGKGENPLFKLYTIKAPVMYDSSGNTSSAIVLSSEGGVIKVIPDSVWLSTATYPVVVDPTVEVSVLNVHSHPAEGDMWEVDFTTVGVADLTITPADQATIDEDEFVSLFCGSEDRTEGAQILSGDVIYYPNWSCEDIATVSHMTLVAGNHHLNFQFGDAFSEAFNAAYVWDGGGLDALWSNGDNWSSNITPTSGDTVTFNNTCVTNCNPVIAANTSVLGITMAANYTGTITLNDGFTLTIGTSGFSQSAGTFNGGTGTTTISGGFTISGGTFNAASTTEFNGNSTTININSTQDFYNLIMNSNSIASKTISSGDILVVNGTLYLSRGNVSTGTIQAKGNIIQASIMEGSSAVIDFANDSLSQTWTVNGGTGPIIRLDSAADANDSIVLNTHAGFNGATVTSAFVGTIPIVNSGNYDLTFGTGGYTQAAGTFNGGTGTTTFSGIFTISGGTFNSATNTRFTGLSHTLDVNQSQTFYNLTFHPNGGSGKTIAAGDTFIVLNELNINDGFLHNPGVVEARGNVTIASAFDGGTTDLRFTGSSTSGMLNQNFTVPPYLFDGDVTVNKSEGEVTLLSSLFMNAANQDLIISSGTLNLNGNNLSATGTSNTIRGQGGTLKMIGSETITAISVYPTFTSTSTVEYYGTSGTYTLKDYTYGGLRISGSGGTFEPASSTLNVFGDFTLSNGIFNASNTTNVYGNWVRTGGTFTHNNNLVSLIGGNQTISGSNTFYNLTKSTSTSFTLTFANGTTQTILNTLTLQGSSGQLLNLRSGSSGSYWYIDPQGTRTLSYINVKDSYNNNITAIDTTGGNNTSSGNNINWDFGESFGQADYRWYQNADSLSLTTPLSGQNSLLTVSSLSNPLRLRMNLLVSGSDLSDLSQSFRLQVSNLSSGGWQNIESTSTLSFYNNPSLSSGTTLSSLLLTTSNATGTYEEINPSGYNPFLVAAGQLFEFDFSLSPSGLLSGMTYFFRMVLSNGNPLDSYSSYAQLVYDPNSNPNPPSALGPVALVNGSWGNDNTPTLFFTITDPDVSDTVRYHVAIDDSADFSSPIATSTSALISQGLFGYYSTSSIPDGAYYWRVSASDNNGAASATTTANSGGVAFRVDTIDPNIGTPSVVSVTSSSVTLTITGASDDHAGLASSPYTFKNVTTDTTSGATSTDTWTFSSLSPSTSYSFYVMISDAAGNSVNTITISTVTSAGSQSGGGSGGSSSGRGSGGGEAAVPPVVTPPSTTPPIVEAPSGPGGGGESVSPEGSGESVGGSGGTTNSGSGSSSGVGSGTRAPSSSSPAISEIIENISDTIASISDKILNETTNLGKDYFNNINSVQRRLINFTVYSVDSVKSLREYIPEDEVRVGIGSTAIAPFVLAVQYSISKGGLMVSISNMRDLWLTLVSLMQGLLTSLGLRKRRRFWGTVYDAVNKQGIDPAIVELVDAKTMLVVEKSITDLFGRFGFLDRPGTYMIRSSKTHYKFPSEIVKGYVDGAFNNVYHGEEFEVLDVKDVIAPNIPMDPVEKDWNQEEKARSGAGKLNAKLEYFVTWLLKILFWGGFVIIFILLINNPSVINIIFAVVYTLLAWLNKYIPDPHLSGRIVSSELATENLLLELRHESMREIVVAKTVTDKNGRFFLKCAPGQYLLGIKSIGDSTNTLIKEFKVKVGSEMIINKVFEI